MFGCQDLLILLTVILCPSDQRAPEDFTVLTPRIVSKLLGTAKHVMLLINCNTTHHHRHPSRRSKLPNYAMPHFGRLGDILGVLFLLQHYRDSIINQIYLKLAILLNNLLL